MLGKSKKERSRRRRNRRKGKKGRKKKEKKKEKKKRNTRRRVGHVIIPDKSDQILTMRHSMIQRHTFVGLV